MGFQSKRHRHLDKVRPGKKRCDGQQDNEEQQPRGTRNKQGDNDAHRMGDGDVKDEKPDNNPSLGDDEMEDTTRQKAEKGAVDKEDAVQKDGNGATEANHQAQGSSKKALPSYQRIDKNFLKAALPKIVKLSRTEIAQDLRVMKSERNAMLQMA